MKQTEKKHLETIVETLKLSKPDKIIVFGSASRGAMHKDSDIDICVITDTKDRLKTKRDLRNLLWERKIRFDPAIDLHVYPKNVYDDYLKRHDPFIEEIEKGTAYYEA